MTRPSLVIVMLAYGGGSQVTGLLRHLNVGMLSNPTEMIVVHNPDSRNAALALPEFDTVTVVALPDNRGYVGGMNAGIGLALKRNPEFVLLLTHDVRITADDIQRLSALMGEHPELGLVGPLLCGPDHVPYSAGFAQGNRLATTHRLPTGDMPRPIWPCVAIDGSVMLWRASALEAVQGFDKRFFMYFEDIDICARAARSGWRVAVASDLRAISARGGSQRRSAHAYLRARNGLAYARTFGTTGFLAGLAECAVGLWRETPKPGGSRFRDIRARRSAITFWRGTLFGVLDYFRGHWGPPPARILRDTDITSASS
jgi:GT2 family glycosyltransferase